MIYFFAIAVFEQKKNMSKPILFNVNERRKKKNNRKSTKIYLSIA